MRLLKHGGIAALLDDAYLGVRAGKDQSVKSTLTYLVELPMAKGSCLDLAAFLAVAREKLHPRRRAARRLAVGPAFPHGSFFLTFAAPPKPREL